MSSGFQRPQAPGERPGFSGASPNMPGVMSGPSEPARGYPLRPALSTFCMEALDGALELVRADGGELALLDPTGQELVTRARRSHPTHLSRGAYGAPSRPSQPLRGDSVPDDPLGLIDDQITQLLPTAQVARVYKLGQGLPGRVWKQREYIMLTPNMTTSEERQAEGLEADAPHHLAVPIFAPERLDRLASRAPVIGALRVFNRDAMWSYTTNDARLLELHVDRLARSLALLDAPPPAVPQDDIVTTLRELNGVDPTQEDISRRVVDIIARESPELGVCVILSGAEGDEYTVAMAARHGVIRQGDRLSASDIPPSVSSALRGEFVTEPAPSSAVSGPLYTRLGWEAGAQVQPVVAAPIGTGPRVAGALLVTAARGEQFTPEKTARLQAIALAAAVFLENARLVEDARRSIEQIDVRNKRLSALANAVVTLNSSLDEGVNLQNLANQAVSMTPAKICAVFVRDEERKILVCRAAAPLEHLYHDRLLGLTLPFDWRNIGDNLTKETFLRIPVTGQTEVNLSEATASLRAVEAVSIVATPIVRQEIHFGALVVFTPGEPAHFASDEIGQLMSLSSQAAVAISNARLYNELQEAYERQKELDRLKNDFILTVSHEFRTPLTAIEGYVTLISRHSQKLDADKLESFASEIHQATAQLAGMISMLADASRMSDQELRVTTHPVKLAATANEAIGRQPPEEKRRIQTRIEDGLWVMGDDERLPLVFTNLISNALKYSGPDKPCRVTARPATREALAAAQRRHALEDGAPEQWVVVTVEDEGPGITPDDQARLFQKFVRLQQSLTTSVRGTGLGLWICRQYVEAMGGEIWVESRIGHGARFSFMVPRADAPSSGA